jgi:hypothetical protein
MRYLSKNLVESGLHHSPPAIWNEVAKEWMTKNAPAFPTRTEEKFWEFPNGINLVKKVKDRSLEE